ncbi:M56 family metallopeptidase, partial [Pyxidicoccus sp. 3LG]
MSEPPEATVSGTGGAVRPEGAVARTPTVASDVRRSGTAAASVPWGQLAVLVLLGLWALGVLWHARSHVKGWAHMRRLRQGARPLEHPVLESEVRALSSVAGLRRAPELLVSEAVASPLATGLLSPAVVLPAKAVRRLPV